MNDTTQTNNNRMVPVLNIGKGFEDITFDPRKEQYHLIIEAVQNGNKHFHGLVSEYDKDFGFRRCTLLEPSFKNRNKGFEGIEHFWHGKDEFLVCLAEHATGMKRQVENGLLFVFRRAKETFEISIVAAATTSSSTTSSTAAASATASVITRDTK